MISTTEPIANQLVELEELAHKIGVFLDLDHDTDNDGQPFIWLGGIERTAGKAGSGRQALEILIEFADEEGIAIQAAVLCWNEQLLAYYAEFGFQVILEGDASGRDDHSIIERPAQ